MKKLLLSFIVILSVIGLINPAIAAPQLGQQFDSVAKTLPTEDKNKIEVMEIFWYGCSHCYHMEKPLDAWLKKLPSDINFKRMPGLPNASWAPMAQAYYTMVALGVQKKLHSKLFDAIHKKRSLNPTSKTAAIDWIVNNSGLDRKKVEDTFNSFTVSTKLKHAAQVFRSSGATGVPSFVIDGKYLTAATMAGGNAQALQVVDYIVNNIRAAKKKTPAKK